MTEILDEKHILEAGRRLGVIERGRKLDLPALVRATATEMSQTPGAQTNIFTNYLSQGAPTVAPSSFYAWFTEEFATLMEEMAGRAVRAVQTVAPEDDLRAEYGRLLEHMKDVRLVDSTAHMLNRLAAHWAPSTSKVRPAGVKLHAVVSLADQLVFDATMGPQRMHDNKAFPENVLEPDTLTIFDLAYIDIARFVDATLRNALFLSRLKSSHNPEIVRIHHGAGKQRAVKGLRLDAALAQGLVDFKRGLIDLDVRLVHRDQSAVVRIVAERDLDGEIRWFITNAPREILPASDVPEAYRLRWIIELVFKHLKSGLGMPAIKAWRPESVRALLNGKIVALCLARLLQFSTQNPGEGKATTELATVLVLARSMPLLMSMIHRQIGTTVTQLEERLMVIASIVARSRNRRRELEKRKRHVAIGDGKR